MILFSWYVDLRTERQKSRNGNNVVNCWDSSAGIRPWYSGRFTGAVALGTKVPFVRNYFGSTGISHLVIDLDHALRERSQGKGLPGCQSQSEAENSSVAQVPCCVLHKEDGRGWLQFEPPETESREAYHCTGVKRGHRTGQANRYKLKMNMWSGAKWIDNGLPSNWNLLDIIQWFYCWNSMRNLNFDYKFLTPKIILIYVAKTDSNFEYYCLFIIWIKRSSVWTNKVVIMRYHIGHQAENIPAK